jgi:3-deoxy-D-manno-octulosonate 8-phosphate phosphatase (KDO 8-P phosphatase)
MQEYLNPHALERAKPIQLVISDVDGVMSDGRVFMTNSGDEMKAFHTRDGKGVKLLMNADIEFAVITGRQSNIVQQRMESLGVRYIYQGKEDKLETYERLRQSLNLEYDQVAYIGDDLPDLPLIRRSGLGVAPIDGHSMIKPHCDWITPTASGNGSLRDLCDLILIAQNRMQAIIDAHL